MEATKNYLLKLLSNNDVTFFIPPYQRNYEWDEEQCRIFFEDILKVTKLNISNGNSEHFFGTIVYVHSEPVFGQPVKLVLTDGQQRITTTMLFLIAMRDTLTDEKLKQFIDLKYLRNDNVSGENEYKIKLKQVETDWEAYRNIVLGIDLSSENKKSSVYINYMYFVKKINDLKKDTELSSLEDLISKGLDKFSIVTIELEPIKNSWENPQEVFESMNSLGKPLSLADLVRNYLLLGKNADEQEELYKDYWLAMEKELPNQISNFIRDFMQLKSGRDYKKATNTNFKELYAGFKILFKDEETTKILKKLKQYSQYYSYISIGTSCGNSEIDKKIDDLRTINVTTSYSLLLDIISHWDNGDFTDKEVIEMLDALIIYFIRRRIIRLTQGENKSLPPLVKKMKYLLENSNKKVAMFTLLSGQENALRLPNDSEVKSELKQMNFYNFNQCKFLLSLVEEKITKNRPSKDDKNLQIEHIMPQKLTYLWEKELGDDFEHIHESYINNIGNLTLIRHNQELGNKTFREKKNVYVNHSGLQIAKEAIIDKRYWNKQSIIDRGKWISDYILDQVIPIPESMKSKNNFLVNKKKKRLSFNDLGIVGKYINYISDKNIVVKIVGDKEVLFEEKNWKLSPLTREIEIRKGTVNDSGSYQGAQHWEFEGIKLADIM